MDKLYKVRKEKELYSVDFTADLASGETISSATVRVLSQSDSGTVTDKTSEFSPTIPAISGAVVTFFLGQAQADSEQAEGEYGLEVLANTSQGRITAAMNKKFRTIPLVVNAI